MAVFFHLRIVYQQFQSDRIRAGACRPIPKRDRAIAAIGESLQAETDSGIEPDNFSEN